jgi:hypothetical protein
MSFKATIEEIKKFYTVYNDRFFVFSNVNVPKEAFVTYNILLSDGKEFPKFPNTISIHRKKQTNTLYTLNAMNQIIKDENNGVFDKSFSVDWNLYANSLIIVDASLPDAQSIKIIPIKLLEIMQL